MTAADKTVVLILGALIGAGVLFIALLTILARIASTHLDRARTATRPRPAAPDRRRRGSDAGPHTQVELDQTLTDYYARRDGDHERS